MCLCAHVYVAVLIMNFASKPSHANKICVLGKSIKVANNFNISQIILYSVVYFSLYSMALCVYYFIMLFDHNDIILSDLATIASRQFCPSVTNLSRRAQSTATPARRITGCQFTVVATCDINAI